MRLKMGTFRVGQLVLVENDLAVVLEFLGENNYLVKIIVTGSHHIVNAFYLSNY
jgi:hypothetical protein